MNQIDLHVINFCEYDIQQNKFANIKSNAFDQKKFKSMAFRPHLLTSIMTSKRMSVTSIALRHIQSFFPINMNFIYVQSPCYNSVVTLP